MLDNVDAHVCQWSAVSQLHDSAPASRCQRPGGKAFVAVVDAAGHRHGVVYRQQLGPVRCLISPTLNCQLDEGLMNS